MDLNFLAQQGLDIAGMVAVPVSLMLARRALVLAEARFHFTLSAANEAKLEAAIAAGAGIVRADLASGKIALPDVAVSSPAIDAAAIAAMNVLGAAIDALGITKEGIAAAIVGAVGHALAEDPTVPSVRSHRSTTSSPD